MVTGEDLLFASVYSEMHDLGTAIIQGQFSLEDKARYDDLKSNDYTFYLGELTAGRLKNINISCALGVLSGLCDQIDQLDIQNLRQEHDRSVAQLEAAENSGAASSSSAGYDPITTLQYVLTTSPVGWGCGNDELLSDVRQIFVNYGANPDGVRRLMAMCEQPAVRAALGLPAESNATEALGRLAGEVGVPWDLWLAIQEQI